jgi:hypothetical protein
MLPADIPNLSDPAVQAHYQPVAVGALRGNPDFPAILLVNTNGDQPPALLLGLDARNGKDTWSLLEDPVILIAVFAVSAGEASLQVVYMDIGFADQGKASGTLIAVDLADDAMFRELLKAVASGSERPA